MESSQVLIVRKVKRGMAIGGSKVQAGGVCTSSSGRGINTSKSGSVRSSGGIVISKSGSVGSSGGIVTSELGLGVGGRYVSKLGLEREVSMSGCESELL